MAMDPRAAAFPWAYSLKVAGIIGIGSFLLMVLMMRIGLAAFRYWRKDFGNPMSRQE